MAVFFVHFIIDAFFSVFQHVTEYDIRYAPWGLSSDLIIIGLPDWPEQNWIGWFLHRLRGKIHSPNYVHTRPFAHRPFQSSELHIILNRFLSIGDCACASILLFILVNLWPSLSLHFYIGFTHTSSFGYVILFVFLRCESAIWKRRVKNYLQCPFFFCLSTWFGMNKLFWYDSVSQIPCHSVYGLYGTKYYW